MSNGSISITPITGKPPYSYNWSTAGGSGLTPGAANQTGLTAGQYSVTITDANSCTATGTFTLTEPLKLDMTLSLSPSTLGAYNINCAGASTGSIDVTAVNNVGTVNYLWSDGATGKFYSNIPAGTYKVILTDQNNCQADSTIILTEPDSIKIVFDVTQAFCPDSPDGAILLTVTGGVIVTDYTYRWSDNSTFQNLSNILKGRYRVIVTDANNCSARDSVKMEPLNETCLIIPNAISPNEDNINDIWNIGMKELYPQMEVKVFNRWGELLWKSEKGYPRPWDGTAKGTKLPIDSYHYIVDLHNGSKPLVGNITIVR
jgi:gliding motility-associated-like protein